MANCPRCNTPNDNASTACVSCGTPLQPPAYGQPPPGYGPPPGGGYPPPGGGGGYPPPGGGYPPPGGGGYPPPGGGGYPPPGGGYPPPPGYPPQGYGPGYPGGPPYGGGAPRTSGLAIAGFVCAFFIPLLGIIFSIMGLNQANRSQGQIRGQGLAIAGIIISVIVGASWSFALRGGMFYRHCEIDAPAQVQVFPA